MIKDGGGAGAAGEVGGMRRSSLTTSPSLLYVSCEWVERGRGEVWQRCIEWRADTTAVEWVDHFESTAQQQPGALPSQVRLRCSGCERSDDDPALVHLSSAALIDAVTGSRSHRRYSYPSVPSVCRAAAATVCFLHLVSSPLSHTAQLIAPRPLYAARC